MFICQLPISERFHYYKLIKKALLIQGVFNLENLIGAMQNKVKDIQGLI